MLSRFLHMNSFDSKFENLNAIVQHQFFFFDLYVMLIYINLTATDSIQLSRKKTFEEISIGGFEH